MRVLDLFCGAGGASMGYHHVWPDAEIVGVDIIQQPDYSFKFIQGNALDPPIDLTTFDFIHASPPCQAFSSASPTMNNHPDLIQPVREMLEAAGIPAVIENVPAAPLRRDLLLCGSMFELQIQRHRIFEFVNTDAMVWNPPVCDHQWDSGRPWSVVGNAGGTKPWHLRTQRSNDHSHKYKNLQHAKELMGMPWATKVRSCTEAIPPVYTEYIGGLFT